MKNYFYLTILLLSANVYSQQTVFAHPLKLKSNADVFEVFNTETKNLLLFVKEKESLKALQLNEKFVVTDSIMSQSPEKKISQLIGRSLDNNNVASLFYTSKNKTDFIIQKFDFKTHNVTTNKTNISTGRETFFQEFIANEKLYLMSSAENSNDINIFIIDNNGVVETKKINLDHIKLYKDEHTITTFNEVLMYNLQPFETATFQNINADTPTSLN